MLPRTSDINTIMTLIANGSVSFCVRFQSSGFCCCREAFAAWLPAFGVPLSYAVAIGYVLVDTADKGLKAYANAKKELDSKASLHPEVDTPRCGNSTMMSAWRLVTCLFLPGLRQMVFLCYDGYLCVILFPL